MADRECSQHLKPQLKQKGAAPFSKRYAEDEEEKNKRRKGSFDVVFCISLELSICDLCDVEALLASDAWGDDDIHLVPMKRGYKKRFSVEGYDVLGSVS